MQQFHQIAETEQVIHIPLSLDKMRRLGEICQLHSGTRVLDLGCGKGELLNQWARHYHIQGVGVDHDTDLIAQAQERAHELEVWSQTHFIESQLFDYIQPFHQYHVVTHLSTVPFAGDLIRTIDVMREALRAHEFGYLLVSETFWEQDPPTSLFDDVAVEASVVPHLSDLSDAFDVVDADLVDMVLADKREMDQYHADQWRTTLDWLRANPTHSDAADIREWLRESRRNYLKFERQYLGWGVFVLMVEGTGE